ncbi:MAG: DNA polymerase III subunit beta [Nanoarchaeota archaeon]
MFKDNLKDGLSITERAVTDNSNLPILKNVLLKTIDGKIKLVTTNLELAITKVISGKIIEEGCLTVPFHTFYNIVNNTNHERINLEKVDNNFIFKTDNYEAKIQGIHEDEFPIIPKLENTSNYLEIEPVTFKDAISKVINAAQISDIRPEISGVLFDFQLTILKLVTTDSFRLAEKTLNSSQFKHNFDKSFKIIIPLKTIQEVVRIFSNDMPIRISLDNNQILFKNNTTELISRLIDGNYPDYEQIIPKEIETEVILNKNHFINSVKLVSNFSGKTNDIRLAIKNNQKTLEVYSLNQLLGENNYLIPAKVKGADFEGIAFNWRYLLDGLRIIEGENVFFGSNGYNKPSLLKPIEDKSYFYILMPIRI